MEQKRPWTELLDLSDSNGRQVAELLRAKFRDLPVDEQDEEWKQEVQELAECVPPQHLTHHLLRRLEKHRILVGGGVSFHRYMVEDSEIRKMRLKSLSWALNGKLTAYRFVDELGIRRPKGNLVRSRFDKVDWQYPGVLKAVAGTGGRGIYLIYNENEIVHVLDGKRLSSREEVREHAYSLMNRGFRPLRNRWIMEELILEDYEERTPARDIKFFCFYGEVLFILEVIRKGRESLYSFTKPDGSPVRPGDWNYNYFDSPGQTADAVELASRISKQIPHPFMRIDMLNGEDGLVFGEFTPRPGGFHEFNSEWDRRMGEAWARAEDRLQQDLLTGKRFDAFLSATNLYGDS